MANWWTSPRVAALRLLASRGIPASLVAEELGATRQGVLRKCNHDGIDIVVDTPEEAAGRKKLELARQDRKNARRRGGRTSSSRLILGVSKTSSIYRNQLPRIPDMTPNERRNMLAEAVRNTAAMRVE